MGKYGKKNDVKLDPLSYNIGLIGEGGIGKTTIIYELCEKLVGDEGYMFLEAGKEDGEEAIQGIVAEKIEDWDKFDEVTMDIIDNKSTEYPNLRVVVADTFDQLVEIAKAEVIRRHNVDNPDKPVKSIKAAFGGYMAGEDMALDIILDRLWELKRVGVHFIVIGHVKKKEIEDVATGQTYSILTTDMSNRDFNKLKTKLHFLGVASIDREIVQQKTGKKNPKTNKEETRGVVQGESRKITFRDDNYSIDSKSRFSDIVESIPFDSDALIKALNDAILKEHSKGKKTIDETKAEQEAAEAKRMKAVAEDEMRRKIEKELKSVVNQITDFIKENKSNMDAVKPIIAKSKELGYANPTLVDNIDDAKAILAVIK